MIGILLFSLALIGTSYAAWSDLKTTEVSDVVSIAMASLGIGINLINSLMTSNWSFLFNSLVVGTSFLGFGALLYFTGMWGGADALILGSTGYLIPYVSEVFNPSLSTMWPYPFSFLMNLFIIGAMYSSFYSVYIASKEKLFSKFFRKVIKNKNRIFYISIFYLFLSFTTAYLAIRFYNLPISLTNAFMGALSYLGVVISLLILYIFFKTVEDHFMVKEIKSENLKEGDVLGEDLEFWEDKIDSRRIKGLDEEQVEKIKEKKEKVKIQRGVTFVVAFPVTVLVTFLYGDLIYNLFVIIA